MPPKRKADSGSDSEEPQSTKKSKPSPSNPTASTQPTNKAIPDSVTFTPKKSESTTRIAAWNVCGLAASQKKGFNTYIKAEDADILVLTETKVNNEPVDPALKARYPHQYWAISTQRKSYSGTAILCKTKPLSHSYTLPDHPKPEIVSGRIVTLEFDTFWLVGTYVVNAGEKLKTLEEKKEWNLYLERHLRDLDGRGDKGVIWTGDLNVAATELDLSNAKKNWNKTAGYTEEETTWFRQLLNPPEPVAAEEQENPPATEPEAAEEEDAAPNLGKFLDVWRIRHPSERKYSYFSYRFNCRQKGLGWRLDMFILSQRLYDRVGMCEIREEIYGGSDHCPVVMEIEGEEST